MPLEASPTYISDLNAAWPLGTDVKSAGDDHLRNIKATLLTTFPSIAGAVTSTHTNLNGAAALYAADAAAAGMLADIAALTDAGADRILFWDDSAGAVARLAPDGTTIAISGATLSVGSNVMLYNAAVPFTGSAFDIQNTQVRLRLVETGATANEGMWELRADGNELSLFANLDTGSANDTVLRFTRDGASCDGVQILPNGALSEITLAGVSASDFARLSQVASFASTLASGGALTVSSGGASITGNSTITGTLGGLTGLTVSSGGASITGDLTTPNTSAAEVGFKGLPQNVQNGDYTFVLTDAGKSVDKQSGGAGETYTIPANASVAFPIGSVLCGDNDGGGTLTIAITSDTLEDTLGNTGSRTVADNGQWHCKKIAATKWRITGAGIS
jgi:hypothetical protein